MTNKDDVYANINKSLDNIEAMLKLLIFAAKNKTGPPILVCGACKSFKSNLCINKENYRITKRDRNKHSKACRFFELSKKRNK